MVRISLLRKGTVFAPFGGVVVANVLVAFMRVFNSSNLGHMWVGCPNSSHNAQGCRDLDEFEESPFLPFCLAFLPTPVGEGVGWFRVRVVS